MLSRYGPKSWYKRTTAKKRGRNKFAQETGLWGQNMSEQTPIPTKPVAALRACDDPNNYTGNLRDDIFEMVVDESSLQRVCQQYRTTYNKVTFDTGVSPVYVIEYGDESKWLVLDELNNPLASDISEWISDADASRYIGETNSHDDFWGSVTAGSKVYHGTSEENVESILSEGLSPRSETRGLSNRYTGDAVFTSPEAEIAASYYDVVFEINVGQMKADGYMPRAAMEEPIEEAEAKRALAWKMGIEDYVTDVEDGMDPGTVVLFGPIPPKYLRKL